MKPIDVSAGLVFRNGVLLITQRLRADHLGGLWEFPGGKRESGETHQDCLKRELREELGIEVAVHELVDEIQHTYPEKTVLLRFYRCSLISGEPQILGCNAFRWVTASELRQFEFPAADARLLDKLINIPSSMWTAGC